MPEDLLKQSKKLKVIGTHRNWSQWCVLLKIYQAVCLPLSIFFYLCYTSTKKFTFRNKNTIALDSLQNLLERYQASSLANTSQHLSPSSAQFLNVSITSLTNHSLVFTNYKYFQLVASPILPLENTTEAIKCRFTTSFPPFRVKKAPALTALLSPTHTSQPFYYIIPLSYINPSLFLPDHPSNNQTCSSIVHLASGRPHPPSGRPHPTSLSHSGCPTDISNPTYQNFPFYCYPSVPIPSFSLSHLGKQHYTPHSCSSQKPPNSFLPSPLTSNLPTSPVNSISKIYLKPIHFSSSSLPPP